MRADRNFFNRLIRFKIGFIFVLMSSVICTSLRAETILIVKAENFLAQYEQALLGCLQELKDRGYKENDNLKLLYMDTSQSAASITRPFDVVYAIGVEGATFAKETFKDRPIVFSMVFDPAEKKLVQNLASPEGNVTGVSLDIPVSDNLWLLKQIIPGQFTLGVIYNSANNKNFEKEVRNAVQSMDINVVVEEINNAYDVPKVLDQMLSKINYFWLILDTTVATKETIPLILERCFQKKIGVYGFSPLLAKAGALCAPIIDYEDIGRQAANLIMEILGNKKQKNMPAVSFPKITRIALNPTVANALGITITPAVKKMVKEYY